MKSENRNRIIKFRVNEEEYEIIKKRMKACEITSASKFIRHMIIHGIYLEFDREELKKLRREISGIAVNINQIAFWANTSHMISHNDIKEVREEVNKVWQLLQSILSELQKLNASIM